MHNNAFAVQGDTNPETISKLASDTTKNLHKSICSFITNLRKLKKITCEADIVNILQNIEIILGSLNRLEELPSQFGIGSPILSNFREVLSLLIDKFDTNFPYDGANVRIEVRSMFLVRDIFLMYESFSVLTECITIRDQGILKPICQLLHLVLTSDIFYEALTVLSLQFCGNNNDIKLEHVVQVLISLPERVANSSDGISPIVFFERKNFCRYLVLLFLKLSVTLMMTTEKRVSYVNHKQLAILLSKIVWNYKTQCENVLEKMVEVIALLCQENSRYGMFINGILQNLQNSSVESLAILILQNIHCKHFNIKSILGDIISTKRYWLYVLNRKIPLMTYHTKNRLNLIHNLVKYLHETSLEVLWELITNVTSSWCSKWLMNQTSVDHHMYLSELLIIAVKVGISSKTPPAIISEIRSELSTGIPTHLECTVKEVKIIGMVTGQIVMNYITQSLPNNDKNIKLEFDYGELNPEMKCVMKKLMSLQDPNYDVEVPVVPNLSKLIEEFTEDDNPQITSTYKAPSRKFRLKSQINSNEFITPLVTPKEDAIKIINETDFDLDSDDDLEPYDLSNDKSITEKSPPPAYLRDLRDGLLETQDGDVFVASVSTCESLVVQQLPNDDPKIGLEILSILLTLSQNFQVDNFNELVYASAVAVTCVFPAVYAEYLSTQFFKDDGSYSINHKILMLDVLCGAAKSLSEIKKKPQNENVKKDSSPVKSAEEVIRQRLELKTRYFTKHKPTLYEQVNTFSLVWKSFFYPLVYGLRKYSFLPSVNRDCGNVLLIKLLQTLAVIMRCSQNCPGVLTMVKELLDAAWLLKYHKEVEVRLSVLALISSVVMYVPRNLLLSNFLDNLIEVQTWLVETLSPNIQKGDPNDDFRALGTNLLHVIQCTLKLDDDRYN